MKRILFLFLLSICCAFEINLKPVATIQTLDISNDADDADDLARMKERYEELASVSLELFKVVTADQATYSDKLA